MGLKSIAGNHLGLYSAGIFGAGAGTVITVMMFVTNVMQMEFVPKGSTSKSELTSKYILIDEAKKKYVPQWESEIEAQKNDKNRLTEKMSIVESKNGELYQNNQALNSQLSSCNEQKQNLRTEIADAKNKTDVSSSETQKMITNLKSCEYYNQKSSELLIKARTWADKPLQQEINHHLEGKR